MDKLKHITLRVNQKTYNDLQKVADNTGLTVSKVIRDCINGNVHKYQTIKVDTQCVTKKLQQDGKLLTKLNDIDRSLHRIGNNVNQIAHYANGNGYVTDNMTTELTELTHEIIEIRKEVHNEWQLYRYPKQETEIKR